MYRYQFKEYLRNHKAKYLSWEYVQNNIKPIVNGWTLQHNVIVRDIKTFTYYSKVPLREVPVRGFMIPAILFDEVNLDED